MRLRALRLQVLLPKYTLVHPGHKITVVPATLRTDIVAIITSFNTVEEGLAIDIVVANERLLPCDAGVLDKITELSLEVVAIIDG